MLLAGMFSHMEITGFEQRGKKEEGEKIRGGTKKP